MPPPAEARLPATVLLLRVTDPPSHVKESPLAMPPPSLTAWLPEIVLSLIVSVPLLPMPPPEAGGGNPHLPDGHSSAVLPTTAVLSRVKVPKLAMPPPKEVE